MQHWTRKHENGVTAHVEPNAQGAGFCYRCAGEGLDADGGSPFGRPALATVADAQYHADVTAHPQCTGECHEWTSAAVDRPQSDAAIDGRHWFVEEERLFGIDVTAEQMADGSIRACAIPFTVDADDLFQYEDIKRERLEFYADTRSAALESATAFLRGRYKAIRPATVDEVPSTPCILHAERIVLRSRDRFARATVDEPEAVAVR